MRLKTKTEIVLVLDGLLCDLPANHALYLVNARIIEGTLNPNPSFLQVLRWQNGDWRVTWAEPIYQNAVTFMRFPADGLTMRGACRLALSESLTVFTPISTMPTIEFLVVYG